MQLNYHNYIKVQSTPLFLLSVQFAQLAGKEIYPEFKMYALETWLPKVKNNSLFFRNNYSIIWLFFV